MKTVAIYLTPKSGYRNELRSDSLWGLICWGIRHLYNSAELEAFILRSINGKPDFTLTSVFPFSTWKGAKQHFFPRPFLPPITLESLASISVKERSKTFKNYRKRKWLHQEEYEKIIQGKWTEQDLFQQISQEMETYKRLPKKIIYNYTHNTIDRIKGSTLSIKGRGQLYHTDEIHWAAATTREDTPPAGIYFLVRGTEERLNLLFQVLRYYQHVGIGGDNSIGKGQFKISWSSFVLQEPEESNALTNLSLYYPREEELDSLACKHSNFRYLLTPRSGRLGILAGSIKKPTKLLFQEGSLFPTLPLNSSCYGRIVDLEMEKQYTQLNHKIFLNGLAWMVKMKIN